MTGVAYGRIVNDMVSLKGVTWFITCGKFGTPNVQEHVLRCEFLKALGPYGHLG